MIILFSRKDGVVVGQNGVVDPKDVATRFYPGVRGQFYLPVKYIDPEMVALGVLHAFKAPGFDGVPVFFER